MYIRYAIGVGLGAIVTFILFLVMQAVIANDETNIDESKRIRLLDMVRLAEDEDIQTKQRKPKPPP
ncbi:MAG: protein TonB, partial [Gammaproteobacteria bacterium]|nr:protein TonB [Gammaproteobacteria bacterium]